MVAGHLARQEALRERLQEPRDAGQLALGDEVDARSRAVGRERPGAVDGIRPLDDMRVDSGRPVELRELDDLLEFLAARALGALADACAQLRRAGGQLLDRCFRRLPGGEVGRVREA